MYDSRLPTEVYGIRKPPKPPLRVGLAMKDGDWPDPTSEAYRKLAAAMQRSFKSFWKNGKDTFEV
jgi:hypothetical protein